MASVPRQDILAPAGLITQPNNYGQFPSGACRVAENVVMRNPGEYGHAPSKQGFEVTLGAGVDNVIHKIMPADSGVVYALTANSGNVWEAWADGVAQTFVGSATGAFSRAGRISWAQCKDRVIVNGNYGCLVRDDVAISTHFRAAGLPQVSVVEVGLSTTSPTWLATNEMVGYRTCIVRRYSDDYTLRSTPSPAVKIHNSLLARSVSVTVNWPTASAAGIEPGDIIELYRTDVLTDTVPSADPGGTFKLVLEHVLTAGEIASGTLTFTDTQQPIENSTRTAGRELYTNPGVEGENYANLRPPIAKCIASFKGFCFYGNTTERAQFKIQVPGGLGYNGTRDVMIGSRSGTGTITAGSAVITGISAANMVGVKVGQLWSGNPGEFPLTATVVAVGASSITMSVPCALVLGTSWFVDDVIEINGIVCRIGRRAALDVLDSLNGAMEMQVNQTLPAPGDSALMGYEATLTRNYHPFDAPITVRGTNGANYSPPIPELDAAVKTIDPITKKNRLCWSKEQQPEHAPSVSETFVGFGEMYAINVTRDAIWVWCSDGLFRLSGNGGSLGLGAWQTDYANATLLLCAPQASCSLDDRVYGYCNDGAVEVDSAGNVRNLTDKVVGDILPGRRYEEGVGVIFERNETDAEVLLMLGENSAGDDAGTPASKIVYVYHTRQRGWTTLDLDDITRGATALAMHRLPPRTDPDLFVPPPEPYLVFGLVNKTSPRRVFYDGWNGPDSNLPSEVQYQPIYGSGALDLKRWLWADYLFAVVEAFGNPTIEALWNGTNYGGNISSQRLDETVYARAGCPREVGRAHSMSPGFRCDSQFRFQGLSLATRIPTNQSKQRSA